MGKKAKIFGGILFLIIGLAIWNLVIVPAMTAPIHQAESRTNAKMQVLDQAQLALDHGDQAKYDQLIAQADRMPDS
jgi:hypothetical protein